jgi:hypothetical protein
MGLLISLSFSEIGHVNGPLVDGLKNNLQSRMKILKDNLFGSNLYKLVSLPLVSQMSYLK